MKKILILSLIIGSLLNAATVTVALAANVSYAINELKESFYKKHPDTHLRIIIGGSGKLTAQIKNGAPYDIFMSANLIYPQRLYKEHFATTEAKVYAYGALALLSQKERDFSQGIAVVTQESIRYIAVANPKTAPYGTAAIEALKNAKLYKKIKDKLIYGESIAQTLSYTMHAADLGFIAKSALYSPKMRSFKEGKNYIEIDAKLYTPIAQGVVLLHHADKNKEAKAFYRFILGKEAKAIFKKYGYSVL